MSEPKTRLEAWLDEANFDETLFGTILGSVTKQWTPEEGSRYVADARKDLLWKLSQFPCMRSFDRDLVDLCEGFNAAEDKEEFRAVATTLEEFRRRLSESVALYTPPEGQPFFALETRGELDPGFTRHIKEAVDLLLQRLAGMEDALPDPDPDSKPNPKPKKTSPATQPSPETPNRKTHFLRLAFPSGAEEMLEILQAEFTWNQNEARTLELLFTSGDGERSFLTLLRDEQLHWAKNQTLNEEAQIVTCLRGINDKTQARWKVRVVGWERNLAKLNLHTGTGRIFINSAKKSPKKTPAAARGASATRGRKVVSVPSEKVLKKHFEIELVDTDPDWKDRVLAIEDDVSFLRALIYRFKCVDPKYHVIIDALLEAENGDVSLPDLREQLKPWDIWKLKCAAQEIANLLEETYGARVFSVIGEESLHRMASTGVQLLRKLIAGDTGPQVNFEAETLDLIGESKKPVSEPSPESTPQPQQFPMKPIETFEAAAAYDGPMLPLDGDPITVIHDLWEPLKDEGFGPMHRLIMGQMISRKKPCSLEEIKKFGQFSVGGAKLADQIPVWINTINGRFATAYNFRPLTFVNQKYCLDLEAATGYFDQWWERAEEAGMLYTYESDTADGEPDEDVSAPDSGVMVDAAVEADDERTPLRRLYERVHEEMNGVWFDWELATIDLLVARIDQPYLSRAVVLEHIRKTGSNKTLVSAGFAGYVRQINQKYKKAYGADVIRKVSGGYRINTEDIPFDHDDKEWVANISLEVQPEPEPQNEPPKSAPTQKLNKTQSSELQTIRANIEALKLRGNAVVLVDFFLANSHQVHSLDAIIEDVQEKFVFRKAGKTTVEPNELQVLMSQVNKKYQTAHGEKLIQNKWGEGYFIGHIDGVSKETEVVEDEVVFRFGPVEYGSDQAEEAGHFQGILRLLHEKRLDDTPSAKVPAPQLAEKVLGDVNQTEQVRKIIAAFEKQCRPDQFIHSMKQDGVIVYYAVPPSRDNRLHDDFQASLTAVQEVQAIEFSPKLQTLVDCCWLAQGRCLTKDGLKEASQVNTDAALSQAVKMVNDKFQSETGRDEKLIENQWGKGYSLNPKAFWPQAESTQ